MSATQRNLLGPSCSLHQPRCKMLQFWSRQSWTKSAFCQQQHHDILLTVWQMLPVLHFLAQRMRCGPDLHEIHKVWSLEWWREMHTIWRSFRGRGFFCDWCLGSRPWVQVRMFPGKFFERKSLFEAKVALDLKHIWSWSLRRTKDSKPLYNFVKLQNSVYAPDMEALTQYFGRNNLSESAQRYVHDHISMLIYSKFYYPSMTIVAHVHTRLTSMNIGAVVLELCDMLYIFE